MHAKLFQNIWFVDILWGIIIIAGSKLIEFLARYDWFPLVGAYAFLIFIIPFLAILSFRRNGSRKYAYFYFFLTISLPLAIIFMISNWTLFLFGLGLGGFGFLIIFFSLIFFVPTFLASLLATIISKK